MTAPQPEPLQDGVTVIINDPDDILVIVEGPGDTTVRPRPPNVPISASGSPPATCQATAAESPSAPDPEPPGLPPPGKTQDKRD